MTLQPRALALALALALAACGDGTKGAAPSASAVATSVTTGAPAASESGLAAQVSIGDAATRKLALAHVEPASALDREIAVLEQRAVKLGAAPEPWVLLGRAWVKKARATADPGFYLSARAAADLALAVAPGDLQALNLRAIVLYNEHAFAEAHDLASQVLARDGDDLLALATKSDALLELGRFAESSAVVQRMVDLKPNLASYGRAATLRWLQGDAAGAKAIARKAIDAGDARDPEPLAYVFVQAALVFWHEGDYAGAEAGMDRALALVPAYPPALAGKGRAAASRGDWARAAELLARAHEAAPLVETAWLLGDALEKTGDAPGAAKAHAAAVKTGKLGDPRTLSAFYSTKNREPEAALALADAELKTRGDLYTHDARAWALYRLGRFAEAKTSSDAALAHGTREAALLWHAGAIRVALGDATAGAKLVREALAMNPKFDASAAPEAEALLAKAAK